MGYDATKAEPRNASANGETAQESTDRMAGAGQQKDGGIKGSIVPTRPAPVNIHPSAPGGHNYGAPVGDQILH